MVPGVVTRASVDNLSQHADELGVPGSEEQEATRCMNPRMGMRWGLMSSSPQDSSGAERSIHPHPVQLSALALHQPCPCNEPIVARQGPSTSTSSSNLPHQAINLPVSSPCSPLHPPPRPTQVQCTRFRLVSESLVHAHTQVCRSSNPLTCGSHLDMRMGRRHKHTAYWHGCQPRYWHAHKGQKHTCASTCAEPAPKPSPMGDRHTCARRVRCTTNAWVSCCRLGVPTREAGSKWCG